MSAVPYPTGSAIRYNISSGFQCGIHDETSGIRGVTYMGSVWNNFWQLGKIVEIKKKSYVLHKNSIEKLYFIYAPNPPFYKVYVSRKLNPTYCTK